MLHLQLLLLPLLFFVLCPALGQIFRQLHLLLLIANITTNLAEGEATNYAAMVDNTENNGGTIKQWSPEILAAFEENWNAVAEDLAAEDEFFQKVWDDLAEYRKGYAVWSKSIYLPR